jgi:hypothetical protein
MRLAAIAVEGGTVHAPPQLLVLPLPAACGVLSIPIPAVTFCVLSGGMGSQSLQRGFHAETNDLTGTTRRWGRVCYH